MRVRTKINILVGIGLFCSIALYVWQMARADYLRMMEGYARAAEQVEYAFRSQQDATEMRMLQIASFVANDPKAQQLFLLGKKAIELEGGGTGGELSQQVRQSLYQHLKQGHKVLEESFAFRQLHFHFSPGSLSFLRVHKPEKFGDYLGDLRFIVAEANKRQQATMGFETGRAFSGLRGVTPVYADDGVTHEKVHVGSLEAGSAFDTLLKIFKENHPWLDAAVLLHKDHLKSRVWPDFLVQMRKREPFIDDYMIEASTSKALPKLLNLKGFSKALEDKGLFYAESQGRHYCLSSLALRDFQGEKDPSLADAGRIVLWRDISSQMKAFYQDVRTLILQAVFLFLAIGLILYFAVRLATKQMQTELESSKKLETVSEKAVEIASALNSDDEGQAHLRLHKSLQEQLEELISMTEAEVGIFWGVENATGEYPMTALAGTLSTSQDDVDALSAVCSRLIEDGLFPCRLGDNPIARGMKEGLVLNLKKVEWPELFNALSVSPRVIENMLLVPVETRSRKLGTLLLVNRSGGFGESEELIATAYASAAALILHTDLREVARRVAEESSKLKTDFLSTMSHELRTPLNAIMGLGKALEESSLDPRQRDYLTKINASSKSLLNMIEEIMIIAQLDAQGNESAEAEFFSLASLLKSVKNMFIVAAANKGVQIEVDCADAIPGRLEGHPRYIELILRQLLGNAIKFSSHGEVVVAAELVNRSGDQVSLRLSVSDEGIGIAQDMKGQIFQPFYQGDGSRTRNVGGTGLGLTIASKICRSMNSEIELESELGKGSTFSFQLDMNAAEHPVTARREDVSRDETTIPEYEESEVGSIHELTAMITDLAEPLKKLQPKPSREIMARIDGKRWPDEIEVELNKLQGFIVRYRFADAQSLLEDISLLIKEKFGES